MLHEQASGRFTDLRRKPDQTKTEQTRTNGLWSIQYPRREVTGTIYW